MTDLKEEISQKQAIIEANTPFEEEMRSIQEQLSKIKTIIRDEPNQAAILNTIQSYVPPDVYFESYNVTSDTLSVEAVAGTTEGFSTFLLYLQSSPLFSDVQIGDIQKEPFLGVTFDFTAKLATNKKVPPTAKQKEAIKK